MTEMLLNTAKAAEFLGLGASTLEKYRLLGQGPKFCKLGSRVLYPTSSLHEWATARLVGSTSEADSLRSRLAANIPSQPATSGTTPSGKRRGRPPKRLQVAG
ncbi:MAG: helix-turn-helix domain-containing protein [Magnetococcales bacterium]|nr:helix-turn-helix domain-containing protein [Magnetococcales bacterium]